MWERASVSKRFHLHFFSMLWGASNVWGARKKFFVPRDVQKFSCHEIEFLGKKLGFTSRYINSSLKPFTQRRIYIFTDFPPSEARTWRLNKIIEWNKYLNSFTRKNFRKLNGITKLAATRPRKQRWILHRHSAMPCASFQFVLSIIAIIQEFCSLISKSN